jgi:glycerol-3-phosphate cytidylyltransferase-like family protein
MNKVACCGTFDYKIHDEHLEFLNFAKSFGDYLCVFIVCDLTVLINKNRMPIYRQKQRCANVLSLPVVNMVIPLQDEIIENSIEEVIKFKPDTYVFGVDQLTEYDIRLEKIFISSGVNVKRRSNPLGLSTTDILRQEGLLCE